MCTDKNKAVKAFVITMSDRAARGVYRDETGPLVAEILKSAFCLAKVPVRVLEDDQKLLERTLIDLADNERADLVVINGSTGVSPRDIAPEAVLNIITKRLLGFEEAMRIESLKKTVRAALSRAVCGIREETLILSVPGSPKGARENLLAVIDAVPHAIEKIHGDDSPCAGNPLLL